MVIKLNWSAALNWINNWFNAVVIAFCCINIEFRSYVYNMQKNTKSQLSFIQEGRDKGERRRIRIRILVIYRRGMKEGGRRKGDGG